MRPLEGIKVVEFASFVAAPLGGRYLGEWGAEVIKVETLNGDNMRGQGFNQEIPMNSDDENLYFDTYNSYKEFVSLNLRDPEGMNILLKLMEKADVFITNYRQKALDDMGLNYDVIKEKFPQLIYAHTLGYGEKGPDKDLAAFDWTGYWARSGLLGSSHQKGQDPVNHVPSSGDTLVSNNLVSAILAAYIARIKTGHGTRITTSIYGCGVSAVVGSLVTANFGNIWPQSRKEVRLPWNSMYKAKDDVWIAFIDNWYDRDFPVMMKLFGREDLIDDTTINTYAALNEYKTKPRLVEIMDEGFATKTSDEWIKIFRQLGIPSEKCVRFQEVIKDEQAYANDYIQKIKWPTGNEGLYYPNPARFSEYETLGNVTFSKYIGYHNEEILSRCGYTPEEINAFMDKKVIADVRRKKK
jgi:Predicted acyl-CoA transferases/carnitine dehydratase